MALNSTSLIINAKRVAKQIEKKSQNRTINFLVSLEEESKVFFRFIRYSKPSIYLMRNSVFFNDFNDSKPNYIDIKTHGSLY